MLVVHDLATRRSSHTAGMNPQGARRLIRSAQDRGIVAVLDSRPATARHRQDLLRGLPPKPPSPGRHGEALGVHVGLSRSRSRGYDLDQVPASVIKDGRHNGAEVGRRLGEFDAGGAQPRVLGMDIVDGELC